MRSICKEQQSVKKITPALCGITLHSEMNSKAQAGHRQQYGWIWRKDIISSLLCAVWRGHTISPNGLLSIIFPALHFQEKCWFDHKVSQRHTYVRSVRLLHACLTRPGRLVSGVNQRSTFVHCSDSFVICASECWRTMWPPSGIQVVWKVTGGMGGTALPCCFFVVFFFFCFGASFWPETEWLCVDSLGSSAACCCIC